MQLKFSWLNSFQMTDDWDQPEELITLEITQKEWSFASAKITIARPKTYYPFAKIGRVMEDRIETIFIGRVIQFPISSDGVTVNLELIAEPNDYQQQLIKFMKQSANQDLHTTIDDLIERDDLFYSRADSDNPTTHLEGNNEIFYWDMKSGELKKSHLFRGNKIVVISGDHIMEKSLHIHLARDPYSVINLEVCVSWHQHRSGYLDLFPLIAEKFPYGMVSSYTDIKAALQNFGAHTSLNYQTNHRYEMVYCQIKEKSPNRAGCLTNYPQISPAINVGTKGASVQFKRFYYEGEMIIRWNYRQKITEIVKLRLLNRHHKNGRQKNLRFCLRPICLPREYPHWSPYQHWSAGSCVLHEGYVWKCDQAVSGEKNFTPSKWRKVEKIPDAMPDDSCGSFFATTRGKNAIKYALQRAAALLNYSSRYIELTFTVSANSFPDLSIADSVELHSIPTLPSSTMRGKVIRTCFIADAKRRLLRVTIGCGIERELDQIKHYSPTIAAPRENFSPADIVRRVEIVNLPDAQIAQLQSTRFSTTEEAKKALRKCNTGIRIAMHPQNTRPEILRTIELSAVEI